MNALPLSDTSIDWLGLLDVGHGLFPHLTDTQRLRVVCFPQRSQIDAGRRGRFSGDTEIDELLRREELDVERLRVLADGLHGDFVELVESIGSVVLGALLQLVEKSGIDLP